MGTNAETQWELEQGEAYAVAHMVDYAESAIVSRTLGKNESGSVTVFAFDEGQSLSEHTVPFDALVHVLDGTGKFVIGGTGVQAQAGEVLLMPANVPHAVSAPTQFKMLLIMLRD